MDGVPANRDWHADRAGTCSRASFSLSHNRFGVSYCEIRRDRVHGTVLRTVVTSADLGYPGSQSAPSRTAGHIRLCATGCIMLVTLGNGTGPRSVAGHPAERCGCGRPAVISGAGASVLAPAAPPRK